jgi:hypothetical protein
MDTHQNPRRVNERGIDRLKRPGADQPHLPAFLRTKDPASDRYCGKAARWRVLSAGVADRTLET